MTDIPEIAYDEVMRRCPMQFLAECRERSPVIRLTSPEPTRNGYLVARQKDVVEVCKDPATFSSIGNPQSDRWGDYSPEVAAIFRSEGWPLERVLVWVDPPEHARFRRICERIFTPAQVDRRAGHIRDCIAKLIEGFGEGGTIEAAAYGRALPAMVMTREFQASDDDFEMLIATTEAIGHSIEFTQDDPAGADRLVAEAAHAITRFQRFMLPKIEAVRREPTNTMLSELANAREGDDYLLTLEELQSILVIFLIAALHSTAGMIAWTLHELCERQDVQARLRREPERIEAFVEECLRLHGTVATSYRTTTREAEIAGAKLPAGAQVFVRWDSSNVDESRWIDPEAFDIDRKGVRGHMAFGSGIHFCVGNTLARKEIGMTIAAFLQNFATIEPGGTPKKLDSFGLHFLTSLPITLSRA